MYVSHMKWNNIYELPASKPSERTQMEFMTLNDNKGWKAS